MKFDWQSKSDLKQEISRMQGTVEADAKNAAGTPEKKGKNLLKLTKNYRELDESMKKLI